MIAFGAGDVGAAQTAGHGGLDSLGAGLHGATDGLLHGAAEGDALLELLSDVLGDELRVGVGVLDLDDVQADRLAEEGFDFLLQSLDARAALADDDARLGGVDGHGDLGGGALDVDVGNARALQLGLQHLAKIVVLNEVVGEILFPGVPLGAPIEDDTNARAMGINFLTHSLILPHFWSSTIVMWLVCFLIMSARPWERAQ